MHATTQDMSAVIDTLKRQAQVTTDKQRTLEVRFESEKSETNGCNEELIKKISRIENEQKRIEARLQTQIECTTVELENKQLRAESRMQQSFTQLETRYTRANTRLHNSIAEAAKLRGMTDLGTCYSADG